MTMQSSERVTCARCKHEQDFPTWGTLNVTLNPELKEPLITGKLTALTCSACGEEAEVVYSLLYHDMIKKYFIWLLPNKTQADDQELEMLRSLGEDTINDYNCRIVRNRNQLVEKILIFDDDLDDRILEILKAFMLHSSEGLADDARGSMYYEGSPLGRSGRRQIRLVSVGGTRSAAVNLKPDAYDDIHSKFAPLLPRREDTLGQWLEINQDCALDVMEKIVEKKRTEQPVGILARLTSWFKGQ